MRLALLASASSALASAPGPWALQLLSASTFPEAKCLDGSPGGFYLQPGDPNSWIVHLQGGGWCINEADCLSRSTTPLGSSKAWPAMFNADGGANGWLSSSEAVNPSFWNATKVFVGYCDGASFSGNIPGGISTGGKTIYFAGGAILDATITTLLGLGMSNAKQVILKGCSAGGLATYLHADYFGTKLNPKTRYVAAPGAGFFLDTPSFSGAYLYTPHYKYIYTMQNVSSRVNQACIAGYENNDPDNVWRCFMAQYTAWYIRTPLFVSNSLYDSWQAANIMGLSCDLGKAGSCSAAEVQYMQAYHNIMIQALQPILSNQPKNGAFLQSCFVHVVEDVDVSWSRTLVGSQTQAQTVDAWLAGSTTLASQEVDSPWPANTGCYASVNAFGEAPDLQAAVAASS